jgi:dolichol-phosphate mannosyltransferase
MVESETLVVVPTYNEAGTIGAIVNGVAELGYSLLVVDDGSPDGTADIAEQLAGTTSTHVMRRTSKDGLGAAYRAGFAWGLDRDAYSVICQMDADLSHDPADLSRLVAAVRQRPGVAIGSRYVQGGSTVGWARSRELLSRGGNRYMRVPGVGRGRDPWTCALRDGERGLQLPAREHRTRLVRGCTDHRAAHHLHRAR